MTKLKWQLMNSIAAAHHLLGTKAGRQTLSDPQRLLAFLQGKSNGTLSVETLLVDRSLGYIGSKTGEYLAINKSEPQLEAFAIGRPYLYELPEYKDNDFNQLTPDFAVNMWSYENQSFCRKASFQELCEEGYAIEGEATFETRETVWATPVYEITPKGNGLIRLKSYVKKQPDNQSDDLTDLLLA